MVQTASSVGLPDTDWWVEVPQSWLVFLDCTPTKSKPTHQSISYIAHMRLILKDILLETTYHLFLDSCVNDKADGLCRPPHVLSLLGREENHPGPLGARLLSRDGRWLLLTSAQDHGHHLAKLRSQPGAFFLQDAVGTMNLLQRK